MTDLYEPILFLHILGAIVAFGPTFAIPFIGARAAKDPQHGAFAIGTIEVISKYLVTPFALSMYVTGGALVPASGHQWTEMWLQAGAGLLVVSTILALGVQYPATKKLAAMLSGHGGEGNPLELIKRTRVVGMVLSVLFLAILALMVFRPA